VAIGTGPEGRDGSVEFFDAEGHTSGLFDTKALEPASP